MFLQCDSVDASKMLPVAVDLELGSLLHSSNKRSDNNSKRSDDYLGLIMGCGFLTANTPKIVLCVKLFICSKLLIL